MSGAWRRWRIPRWGRAALVALACLGLVGLGGCGSRAAKPGPAVDAYLSAWSRRDWSAMAALIDRPPPDLRAQLAAPLTDLGVRSADYLPGRLAQHGSTASVALTGRLSLASGLSVALHGVLDLRLVHGRWLVRWSRRSISSALGPGDHFELSTTWPRRAPVLGAGGTNLIPEAAQVTVGVAGLRIKDATTLRTELVAAGLNAAAVSTALAQAAAHPANFEPIQTISQSQYQAVKARIYPLPGTQFETTEEPIPLTPALGAQIVGQIGPVTAQELRSLGGPYAAGDLVGQGGIEAAYERQLAGRPAVTARMVDAKGKTVDALASRAAVPGRPVRTSIDPTVQKAAEGAVAGEAKPAAIVVVRASTGEVLASVSTPTEGFDLALDGSVPPGSTFKIVTSTALLQSGVTLAQPTTCPPTIDVGGRSFHNYEGESAASLSFVQAFAQSCNTAFIGLSRGLPDGALTQDAATYGIGVSPHMGLAAYGGKVPAPRSQVDLAATAIGQGEATVSPLAMADMAATVDSGSLHAPRLVVGAPDDSQPAKPIDPTVDSELHVLMNAVVTNPAGTAAGAGLPAGTFGKTGTAEYGSGPNPPTDAWFIGFRGDLAFAVFVYGGGTGGTVAAPMAAKMLDTLGPG